MEATWWMHADPRVALASLYPRFCPESLSGGKHPVTGSDSASVPCSCSAAWELCPAGPATEAFQAKRATLWERACWPPHPLRHEVLEAQKQPPGSYTAPLASVYPVCPASCGPGALGSASHACCSWCASTAHPPHSPGVASALGPDLVCPPRRWQGTGTRSPPGRLERAVTSGSSRGSFP